MSNPLINSQNSQTNGISFGEFMNKFKQFSGNPMQMLGNMGIPQGMNNPGDIVQYMIGSGKISPQQLQQIQQTAAQIRNSPMFQNAMKK